MVFTTTAYQAYSNSTPIADHPFGRKPRNYPPGVHYPSLASGLFCHTPNVCLRLFVPIDRVELSSTGYESVALPLSYTGRVSGLNPTFTGKRFRWQGLNLQALQVFVNSWLSKIRFRTRTSTVVAAGGNRTHVIGL